MQHKILSKLKYYLFIVLSACCFMSACSKSSRLVSIEITPINAHVSISNPRQFMATGFYADHSVKNITSSVTWKSSIPTVATIASSGIATGVAVGITNITATVGSIVSNEATLRVANPYAYISSLGGALYLSMINGDGTLSNSCTTLDPGYGQLAGLALSTMGNYLYIAGTADDEVAYCVVNPDGTLTTSCNTIGGFNGASGIGVNPAGNYVYIGNIDNGTVSYCSINADGTLSNSCNTIDGFNEPGGIAINFTGTTLYVSDESNNQVSSCPINNDGTLSGFCTTIAANTPGGVGVSPMNNYAYISNLDFNFGTDVTYCPINSDGTVNSSCTILSNATFSFTAGIANSPAGNYAYVANIGSGTVSSCIINSDGTLSSACVATNPSIFPFTDPDGIAVY